MASKHEITEEYKKELEAELDNLINVLIPKNTQALTEAKAQGDLSENADYDAARDEQARLNARKIEIKDILDNSIIITVKGYDKVQTGVYVTIEYTGPNGKVTDKFKLTSPVEADITSKKLSIESPIGKAIIDHKKGDVAKAVTPIGIMNVKVIDISKE